MLLTNVLIPDPPSRASLMDFIIVVLFVRLSPALLCRVIIVGGALHDPIVGSV